MKKFTIFALFLIIIITLKATNWSIQLEVTDTQSQDIDNYFGVHQNALDSHDSLDALEPPSPPPPFVKLYFPHQDWGAWNGNYTNDIKSDFITNKYWFVNIQSSSPSQQSYTLQWNSLDEVPDYYNLILQNGFDMIDMREQNEYQFSSSSNTISIMTMARPINGYPYISEQIDSLYFEDYTPQQFELNDYFSVNGSSSLSYQFLENLELAQSIEGSIYTISPIPGWSGNETISITAIGNAGEVTMQVEITGNNFLYGDIDENFVVQAFDASLVLQYSIGLDPLPQDPIPWENWRETASDVDGNGSIQAFDAALILQFSIGLITEFPVQE